MAEYSFTAAELGTSNIGSLVRRTLAGGYTNVRISPENMQNDVIDSISVEISESPSREDLKSVLISSEPKLTLTPPSITCISDGVDVKSVTLSGPVGTMVDGIWLGALPIDGVTWTLSGGGGGSGTATINIGPFQDGWRTCSEPVAIRFIPRSPEIQPVALKLTVRP